AQQASAQATKAARIARTQANRAHAGALASQALAELPTTPELAIRDAVSAANLDPTARAQDVLRRALAASSVSAILPAGGPASGASASPDGSSIVTADANPETQGIARIFRPNGELLHTLPVGSHVLDTAVSPDGRLVATASRDGWARIWDMATGAL